MGKTPSVFAALVAASLLYPVASEGASSYSLVWTRQDKKAIPKGVVIFVHGLTGTTATTWGNRPSWLEIMEEDDQFDGYDIVGFNYASGWIGRNAAIQDFAKQLCEALSSSPLNKYAQYTFVAHSQGGLVVRQCLTDRKELATRVRLSYMFATPSGGSDVASSVQSLPIISENVKQLAATDDPESFLAKSVRSFANAGLGLRVYCAYETAPTGLTIKGHTLVGATVVKFWSAAVGCSDGLNPIAADHVAIAKPRSPNDPQHSLLRAAFQATEMERGLRATGAALPLPHSAVASVLTQCYRRAVFIKTQMEDDPTLAAMYASIEQCKKTIEREAPKIPKREIRSIIYEDLEPALAAILSFRDAAQKEHKTLLRLEPANPNGPYEEIDAQKIIAQHAFRKLVIQTGSVYVLSRRTNLPRPRYWCESAIASTPSVSELTPTKASLNPSDAYDPCKLVP